MGSALRYWQLVRLSITGNRKIEVVDPVKTFVQQRFSTWIEQGEVSDTLIQRELLTLLQNDGDSNTSTERNLAEQGLRCFISHQIEQVCIQLEMAFGARYGFSRYDLFPFVLDDDGKRRSPHPATQYRSLSSEILRTFDPNRATLSTWTMRLVRQHSELNGFLRQRGVYIASDWSILSDTSPEQLQRVLSEFHSLTPTEIEQASHLLQGYHLVYRQDRFKQRQAGILKGKPVCVPPTPDQLTRIAHLLHEDTTLLLTNETILSQLQTLATYLRQYRVYIRGGSPPTQSLDQPESITLAATLSTPEADQIQAEQNEFLVFYRQQFLSCLDQAIDQTTRDRIDYLQRKNPTKANTFLTALHLFHCQGKTMTDIATHIGLKAQFEVTRLMNLKEFRTRIRQQLLGLLGDRILNKAKTYVDAKRLHDLDQQLESALDEQIATVMQQAETEIRVTRNQPLSSLFSRRLCHHLDQRGVA